MREIKDKNAKALGEEMTKVATEGKVDEVSYMWPRPGADTTPVQNVSFVTKTADQVCGVGYYKYAASADGRRRYSPGSSMYWNSSWPGVPGRHGSLWRCAGRARRADRPFRLTFEIAA
jgi:hypothetical protein